MQFEHDIYAFTTFCAIMLLNNFIMRGFSEKICFYVEHNSSMP